MNDFEGKIRYYQAHAEFGIVYSSGYKHYFDTGKIIILGGALWKTDWVFNDLLGFNFINAICVVIKKSTFDTVGQFDET